MDDPLSLDHEFDHLSVKDLLEARDLYHNHLLGKPNVIGTAIGLYLIRDDDHASGKANSHTERRLDNAKAQNYSNPAVLAFVTEWITPDAFGGLRPDAAIPTRLYMPDGRVAPVCIIKVTPAEVPHTAQVKPNWPDSLAGGGFPISVEVQGAERVASVGCLVSDGHSMFALTNRHVCGAPGTPVYTRLRGKQVEIGHASDKQVTRLPFTQAYPNYPGSRAYSALDVGLVELNDVTGWTSQIYGIGAPGELADLSERTISLRLIGAPVKAFGAASGPLDGRIMGLFYRYKSVGGFDWIADFLIAPELATGPQTRPGDSGSIWFLPPANPAGRPRPLAIEWGGQTLLGGNTRTTVNVALATSLSTVCNLLDVDVAGDHNTGYRLYWGSEGHYTIAALAIRQVADPALAALMQANADSVAFDVSSKSPDAIAGALKQAKDNVFIPLADVPDIVWKQSPAQVPGGRDTQRIPGSARATGPEHPCHYADVDASRPSDGKTLLQLSLEDPANISVAFWQQFYNDVGSTQMHQRGLLPFRCWQFFDAMVDAVRAGKPTEFVCAAGILSHYVGDACQPLHGSIYSNGDPDQTLGSSHTIQHRNGTSSDVTVLRGAGVHSAYEDMMVDLHAEDLHNALPTATASGPAPALVGSGHDAARAILELMDRTQTTIPPKDLVEAYVAAGGGKSARVGDALWDKFGPQTISVMADGARVLAMLWDSAWTVGGGIAGATAAIPLPDLQKCYEDTSFVPSLDLEHIGPVLGSAPAVAAPVKAARAKPAPSANPATTRRQPPPRPTAPAAPPPNGRPRRAAKLN